MKQLIDKSAVVAEIERRIKETESMQPKFDQFWAGQISAFKGILKILDTFESKEVDLEKELDAYTADNFWALEGNNESPYLVEKDDMLKVAKHFYELGLRAKDVNEIIKTAEDHAYFAGSENTREKLIDKACKWWEEELSYPSMTQEEIKWYKSEVNKFRKAMEE